MIDKTISSADDYLNQYPVRYVYCRIQEHINNRFYVMFILSKENLIRLLLFQTQLDLRNRQIIAEQHVAVCTTNVFSFSTELSGWVFPASGSEL